MSSDINRDAANGDRDETILPTNGSGPSSPNITTSAHPGLSSDITTSDGSPQLRPKVVDDVVNSDIGITTLLSRLKQSIASARDFAQFLKKRSTLEEDQANGLKRLAKIQLDGIRKSEVRGGSYAAQLAEVLRVHERMGDNGMQFALSLHQMHEDLDTLSNNMERGRKQWKHEGLDAEKKSSDAEQAMQKAKSRYDNLAEDYDRARTGDTKGSRRIGLKGPKSAEQYEQDLLRKTQAADTDYEEKVRQAKAQREHLLSNARPQAVRALQELIKECDSALTLQLQKFATFNEKLLLGNGLAVSPLSDKDGALTQRSMRDLVTDIDNDSDFHNYVSSFSAKVQNPSDIKYEQHSTFAPKQQQPRKGSIGGLQTNQPILTINTGAPSQPASTNSRYAVQPPPAQQQQQIPTQQPPPIYQLQQPIHGASAQDYKQITQPPHNSHSATVRENNDNVPPYPTHPSDRVGASFGQQPSGSVLPAASASMPQSVTTMAPPRGHGAGPPQYPLRPVFGVSLADLFARDASAVPMIVFQCMQAVDLFGLDTEGIYRLSGTTSHVNALRNAFDTLPTTTPQLDFRNPANFFHDVNSVATLLKQFFRDLPDPLLTRAQYDNFIQAAKIDEEDKRRDALHQGINDLPDPNYATLRALVLHLWRIMQNESRTRMGSSNLAVCFAPSLMGQHTGNQIADAGLQARVVDTILSNATAIFDED